MGSGQKSPAKIQGRQGCRSCLWSWSFGPFMLILDDSSRTAIAVDNKIPSNSEKLSAALMTSWPRLKSRIIFKQVPVEEFVILPGGLEGWMDKTLAVDTIRAVRLRSMGYTVVTQKIPSDITPKNRLLMGECLKDNSTY